MKRVCKTQCSACPFRSTALRRWLGGYQTPNAVFSSLWHKEPFFCHTRTDYTREGWLARAMKGGQLCLGSLIFIGRESYWPKPDDPEIAAAVQVALDYARANPDKVDVMGPRQFIDYHQWK